MGDSMMSANLGFNPGPSENNSAEEMRRLVESIITPLSYKSHKGVHGRIGVFGGSKEYTGAPYFSAISALKVGCDLSYVFCAPDAAPIIKSYSPELIVYPILGIESETQNIIEFLPRLHSLVIGPGLGRTPQAFTAIHKVLDAAKTNGLHVVLDADALFFVNSNLDSVKGYRKAVLTPNIVELSRLYKAVYNKDAPHLNGNIDVDMVKKLSVDLGNVTLVCKGAADIITNGEEVVCCTEQGSPRRCGGQGDLLSGSMGVFLHWGEQAHASNHLPETKFSATMIAAFGACMLTRRCNRLAFEKLHRSMTTSNMIAEIGNSFCSLFPKHSK